MTTCPYPDTRLCPGGLHGTNSLVKHCDTITINGHTACRICFWHFDPPAHFAQRARPRVQPIATAYTAQGTMCVQSFSRPRKPLQNRVRESSPEMVASVPMAPFWGEEDEGREEGGEGEKEEDDSCRGRVSSSVSSSSPPDSFSEDVFTLPNSEPYIPPSSYGSADAPPPTTRLCRTWTWDRCDVNKWLAGVQVETELVLFVEHTTSFKNKPLASRTHQLDLD